MAGSNKDGSEYESTWDSATSKPTTTDGYTFNASGTIESA